MAGDALDKRKIQRAEERWQEDKKRRNLQCLAESPKPIAEPPKVVEVKECSNGNVCNSQRDPSRADKSLGTAAAEQCGVPSLNAMDPVNDGQRCKNRTRDPLFGSSPRWPVGEIFRTVECCPMRSPSPDAVLR